MFTHERYATDGITEQIPAEIQLGLWIMIDNLRNNGFELSYLQVFTLSAQGDEQLIVHEQEQPDYRVERLVPFLSTPVAEAKIFVIDDGTCSTMLLADEY